MKKLLPSDLQYLITANAYKVKQSLNCYNDYSFEVTTTPAQLSAMVCEALELFETTSGVKIQSLEIDNSGRNYYFNAEPSQTSLDYKSILEDFDGRDEYKVTITFS